MKNYEQTLIFLKRWQERCPVCGKRWELEPDKKVDLHHQLHNDAHANIWYKLFKDSVLNLMALHHDCHLENGNQFHWDDESAKILEGYLGAAKAWKKNPTDKTIADNYETYYTQAYLQIEYKLKTEKNWHNWSILTMQGYNGKIAQLLDKAAEMV